MPSSRNADQHPAERRTDHSIFQRLNAKIAEYRALIYVATLVLIALGWRFQSPGERITRVESDIHAVRDTVVALRRGQDSTHNALDVLARLRCFDSSLTFQQKRLAGLDCSEIDRAIRNITR